LEELAFEAIKYVLLPDESGEQALTERDRFLLSDEYKRQAIGKEMTWVIELTRHA
jgi:hypothetical protein